MRAWSPDRLATLLRLAMAATVPAPRGRPALNAFARALELVAVIDRARVPALVAEHFDLAPHRVWLDNVLSEGLGEPPPTRRAFAAKAFPYERIAATRLPIAHANGAVGELAVAPQQKRWRRALATLFAAA